MVRAEQKDQVNYVPEFRCVGGPYGLQLPKSYNEVKKIGKLKSEKVLRTESWDNYKTHERELVFDGLRLYVITFTNDRAKYLIAAAEITKRRWFLAGNFRVGDLIEEAQKKLNAQTNPKAHSLEFGGESDSVIFRVSGGRITTITYDCYTG